MSCVMATSRPTVPRPSGCAASKFRDGTRARGSRSRRWRTRRPTCANGRTRPLPPGRGLREREAGLRDDPLREEGLFLPRRDRRRSGHVGLRTCRRRSRARRRARSRAAERQIAALVVAADRDAVGRADGLRPRCRGGAPSRRRRRRRCRAAVAAGVGGAATSGGGRRRRRRLGRRRLGLRQPGSENGSREHRGGDYTTRRALPGSVYAIVTRSWPASTAVPSAQRTVESRGRRAARAARSPSSSPRGRRRSGRPSRRRPPSPAA